jgi:hypothetical protein
MLSFEDDMDQPESPPKKKGQSKRALPFSEKPITTELAKSDQLS